MVIYEQMRIVTDSICRISNPDRQRENEGKARYGAYATPKEVIHLIECSPKPSVYSVLGVGLYQTQMVAMGITLGINVRTGMEDNVLYKKGELCKSNAQLVERVVRIAREMGREIATPKQARQMLGLSEKPSRY